MVGLGAWTGGLLGRGGPLLGNVAEFDPPPPNAGLLHAGGGCGAGPRSFGNCLRAPPGLADIAYSGTLGDVELLPALPAGSWCNADLLLGGLGAESFLLAGKSALGPPEASKFLLVVDRNFGIPPANKPPKLAGAPFERAKSPLPLLADFLPTTTAGVLRSFVTAFFKAVPVRMEASKAPRLSPSFLLSGGVSNVGGGGGPGGGGGGGMITLSNT